MKKQKITQLFLIIFAALTLVSVLDFLVFANRVHYGVETAGLSLSFLSESRAAREISLYYQKLLQKPVSLQVKGEKIDVYAKEISLKVDSQELAKRALKPGRGQGFFLNLLTRFRLYFQKEELKPRVRYNRDELEKILRILNNKVRVPPEDARLVIKSSEDINLIPGKEGKSINFIIAEKLIVAAFIREDNRVVKLNLEDEEPEVTAEEVKKLLPEIKKLLSKPILFNYQNESWVLTPEDLVPMISFQKTPAFKLTLKLNELKLYLKSLMKEYEVKPINASFKVYGNSVQVIPSQEGKEVDVEAACENILSFATSDKQRIVELKLKSVEPDITTAEAKAMGIKERISYFTTYFDPSQSARVNNIRLLAKSLDGALIAPGETFSVNQWIGPRTAEKGYKEAPTIVNGKLVPSLGGGVCQVATTLFNAVFFAGLPVIERHNHSFYISKYPKGRDATLSYGSLDLKFKNDKANYILIKCFVGSGSLTIALYGYSPGIKVRYETSPFTNIRPFKTEIIKDPNLTEGKEEIEEHGVNGGTVVVKRKVYRNGVLIREDKFISFYRAKSEIKRVGTKPIETLIPTASLP